MRSPTLKSLRQHVWNLCSEHKITVTYSGSNCPTAWAEYQTRLINIPRVTSQRCYFTALHEIGHLVYPPAHCSQPTLEREASAWQWAIDNAVIKASRQVWRVISHALGSYCRHFRVPPQDGHCFWEMTERCGIEFQKPTVVDLGETRRFVKIIQLGHTVGYAPTKIYQGEFFGFISKLPHNLTR